MPSPTIRWGRRSHGGGVVRRGAGGWYLDLQAPPVVTYMDPVTGASMCIAGWRVLRAIRRCRDYAENLRRHRMLTACDDVISADDARRAWDNLR